MTGQADRPQATLSLPQGGGALSGIGEAFSPDLHTGTANLTIPLPLPAGRNGFGPKVGLAYTSGSGNGPFGLGWGLDVPAISRKTSLGVPVYEDDKDVFILAGGEDLVPVGSPSAGVTSYRPRTEGAFAHIDRHREPGSDYWVVRTKDGLTSTYGTVGSAGGGPAVISDPADADRIFSWKLTSTTDPFGNRIEYRHERDAIRADGPHGWDQLYLSDIRYVGYGDAAAPSYLVTVSFSYEQRPDPCSDYRAGFEIRTIRRCTAIQLRTNAGSDQLTRMLSLTYADQQPGDQAPVNGLSLLAAVTATGHDGTQTQALPPVTFGYTRFAPAGRQFVPVGGPNTPIGVVAGSDHELLDLLGRGLPDVVQLNGTARYWPNAGEGRFAPPRNMPHAPAGVQLGQPGVRFLDANGDGHLDLMVTTGTAAGYFPWNYAGYWDARSFRPYPVAPSFDPDDPQVHLVDLTGNGVTDAIRSGGRLDCFFCDPATGWDSVREAVPGALADFPAVSFADPRVTFADMTGDGLQDIVYVHDRIVQYWPNLGHGNWGKRITMGSSPALPFGYDPARVLVGDIDGDGCADLVYAGPGQVTLWINRSGNSWSGPVTIDGTPGVPSGDLLRLIDLYGNGVPGLLFSATAAATPSGRAASWYLEFTGGTKPYLLAEIDNHIGAITRLSYASSTSYRLSDDRKLATRWPTTLPFPVQVLARAESIDAISGSRLTSEYSYHYGYWDGTDHEFRGFGRVDQTDTENLHLLASAPPAAGLPQLDVPRWCPPLQTRTWFHVGPVGDATDWTELDYTSQYWSGDPATLARPAAVTSFLRSLPRPAQRDAIRTLRGSVLRTETYGLDGSSRQDRPYAVTETMQAPAGLPVSGAWPSTPQPWQLQVFFPRTLATRTTRWERGSDPLTRISFTDSYDSYGQLRTEITVAVPRGRDYTAADPDPSGAYLATYTRTDRATRDDDQVFIANRTARTTSYEIVNDGSPAIWALHEAVLSGTAQRQLYAQARTYYDGPAFTGRPLGQLGWYGAAVRNESLVLDDAVLEQAYQSGTAPANPPERPPYLPSGGGGPAWTADYPAGFRSALPPLAGFSYNPGGADPDDQPGYFAASSRYRFDFHVGPAGSEGPPGTGIGLLQVTRDPLGNDTTIVNYDPYQLFPAQVRGPTGLVTVADHDYRVLQVRQLTAPNGNRSVCTFTPLGLVDSVAVMGKPGENVGDTPATPSIRYRYDLAPLGGAADLKPISVRTIRRVYHVTDTTVAAAGRDDTHQLAEYSDGFGRKIQTRTEAADLSFGSLPWSDSGLPLDPAQNAAAAGHQRGPGDPPNVCVTGWVIYDNKNHVIRSYEPFYATGLDYEVPASTQLGQHEDLYFDPPGRNVLTVNPDESHSSVIYGVPGTIAAPDLTSPAVFEPTPWETYRYDPNDNAGRTSPAASAGYQSHWNTPSSTVTDALGRVIIAVARNGPDEATNWFSTATSYDIRGNVLRVTDTLGRITYQRAYDYANRCLRTDSLDAGIRRTIADAAGSPVEQRSSTGSLTLTSYDPAHRAKQVWARDTGNGAVTLRELLVYGESADSPLSQASAASRYLLGQLYQHYDEAGRRTLLSADFKANPLETTREVVADQMLAGAAPFVMDWQVPAGSTIVASAAALLDPQVFATSAAYNALNQVITTTTPATVDGIRHVITPTYDRARALMALALDGQEFVSLVAYNARGQRVLTGYGNGIMTRYGYDPVTFRPARVRTERFTLAGVDYQPSGAPIEDRLYDYDLVGNILAIGDRTPGSGVKANPAAFGVQDPVLGGLLASGDALVRDFSYDPLYRLISATGRECSNIPVPRPWTDDPRCGYGSGGFGSLSQDNAPSMTTPYTETYGYDPVGDLVTLSHQTSASSWTRNFGFGGLTPQDWQAAWVAHLNTGNVWTAPPATRLTHFGNDPASSPANYSYDVDGNLTGITTSRHLDWSHDARLAAYRTQAGNAAPSVTASYLYDADGIRIKKVAVRGPVLESTVYIDGIFEQVTQARATGTISQNTLHLISGGDRVATMRVGTPLPRDMTPAIKYAFGDHLGSSATMVDDTGTWLNREEFSPYGETILGSFAHKRYRYAGRERDEASGLDYSRARYYAPWLARWVSPDPLTIQSLRSDLNPYAYVGGNPIIAADVSGLDVNSGQQSQGAPELAQGASGAAQGGTTGQADRAGPGQTAVVQATDGGADTQPTGGTKPEFIYLKSTASESSDTADLAEGGGAAVKDAAVEKVQQAAHDTVARAALAPLGLAFVPFASLAMRPLTDRYFPKRIDDWFNKLKIDPPYSQAGGVGYLIGWFLVGAAESAAGGVLLGPSAAGPEAAGAAESAVAAEAGEAAQPDVPQFLFRTGSREDYQLTDPSGVSFRSSFSSSADKVQVFRPGDKIFAVDARQLPPGSVDPNNEPFGHVSVFASPEQIRAAIVPHGPDNILEQVGLKPLQDIGAYRLPKR